MLTWVGLAILVAQCSGPWCGPDTAYERPGAALPGDAAQPSAALTESGALLVAWEFRGDAGESDILVNRREPGAGGAWGELPARVDGDDWGAARSLEPRIVALPDERALVLWQDARDGADQLWLARSTDDGRTWGDARRLRTDKRALTTESLPDLAVDAAGNVFVVWEDLRAGRARDLYFRRSTDGGVTFEAEHRLDTDPAGHGVSYHPLLATAAGGVVLVTWWDERDGDADVYVRRSTDAGATWVEPEVRLDPGAPGEVVSRDVRVQAHGTQVTVVWEEARTNTGAQIVGRTSTDAGATWGELIHYGDGQDPVVMTRGDAPACVAWAWREPRPSGERTAIGGRVVDIPLPVPMGLSTGRPAGAGQFRVERKQGLDAHDSLWMGRMEQGVFAVRAGAMDGRGALDAHFVPAAPAAAADDHWSPVARLQFGENWLNTAADVRAMSLTGAAAPDGAVHLVWIASFEHSQELGHVRLER